MNRLSIAAAFLASLRVSLGHRLVVPVILSLVGAVLEGVGLLALLPIITLLGSATGETSSSLTGAVSAFLGGQPSLGVLLVVFVGLLALRAVVVWWREVERTRLRQAYLMALRIELFRAVGAARWSGLTRRSTADLTTLLTTDLGRVAVGTEFVLRLPALALMATAHLAVAVALSPIAAGLAIAVGLVLWWFGRAAGAFRFGESLTRSNMTLMRAVTDFLTGLKLARSFGRVERHLEGFAGTVEAVNRDELNFIRSTTRGRAIFQIGAAIALASLVHGAVDGMGMVLAELAVLVLVFARLLPAVSEGQQALHHVANMLPAFEMVRRTIDDLHRDAETAGDGGEPISLVRDIRLVGVSWRHESAGEGEGAAALDDVSIEVPANRMTAIVGHSGAGKSTLADVLIGLLSPVEGEVRVDGILLSEERLAAWRREVAYVPQETFLFDGSIRDNLAWAEPEATEDRLWEALELAAIDEKVRSMPNGLDSAVGSRGLMLSGGERQRIALARALLRRPRLLVLDEATSALDARNDEAIRSALARLRPTTTIVVIAHRFSTIRDADRIIVLDRGRVVMAGPWEELRGRHEGASVTLADNGIQPSRPQVGTCGRRRCALASPSAACVPFARDGGASSTAF